MATGTRLLGRAAEQAKLADAVTRARDGAPSCVVIEGDAGIGKSRLLAATLTRHRDPKDHVALGHGIELVGGELPYGTVTDALRALVRDAGADAVRTAAGPYADRLAALVPALGAPPAGGMDRTQLLPAYVALIENLAADRLVWLAIEDLHWVDASSRDLLTYLIRVAHGCQLLVLLAVRTHDPATGPETADLVTTLTTLDHVSRITLAPLDVSDTATLVTDLTAGAATRQQIARVVDLAQGSPLLVEQLVAAGLAQAGPVPEGVTAPMARRIQGLDPATSNLLRIACLTDGHLPHRLLRSAFTTYTARESPAEEPAGFDAAVNRALEDRLLQFDSTERTYSFTHALLRQAVDTTVTPADRIRGHRTWAQLLSRPEYGTNPHLQIAAAHHWAAAEADNEAFDAALRAAAFASQLDAPAEAAPLLHRALTLWDRVPDPARKAGRGRDELLCETVVTYEECDQARVAVDVLDAELERAATTEDPLRTLCLRVMRDEYRQYCGEERDVALVARLVRAQPELMAAAPSELINFALRYLGSELRDADPDASLQACQRAMDVARDLTNSRHLQDSVTQLAIYLTFSGRFDEALALTGPAREQARGHDARGFLNLSCFHAAALHAGGRFREAQRATKEGRRQLPDPRLHSVLWAFSCRAAGEPLYALGEWDQAQALLAQARQLDIDDAGFARVLALWDGQLQCGLGNWESVEQSVRELRAILPADEEAIWYLTAIRLRHLEAQAAAGRGDYERARERLSSLLRLAHAEYMGEYWSEVLTAAGIEADRRNATGDAADQALLDGLSSLAERLPHTGDYNHALYLHTRALLARARGCDTVEDWDEAVNAWRNVGHQPLLGWALYRLGDVHVRVGERPAAAPPLAEAWALAVRMGAVPVKDAVVDLARRAHILIGARPAEASGSAAGPLSRLTKRELEVLLHLARGATNDELAQALFISPKTASVHVSRILAKLGVPNRAKAAALAYEHGLLGSEHR